MDGSMEKTKLVKKLPCGKVVEIDLQALREAGRKGRKCLLGPGGNFGPAIIYDRNDPDVAEDHIHPAYLPFHVQGCKDLAKFAIDSFNKDNPHIPPYSTDAVELIRATAHRAVLYRLTFSTTIPDFEAVSGGSGSVSVSTTFEAEICWSLGLPIADAKVRYVKILDHPPPPPQWTTGELPFCVNMC